ncbi:MAG: phasin family protein [Gammaproteobacteria bacterium]|nr:phasin family protein [Gammaproteobacteria bacterium]
MAGSNDDTTRQPHDGPTEKKARRVHDAAEGIEQQAERLARSLGESAHHVWLAGVGALARAQSEGSRLFSSLVEEGAELERQARKAAGDRATEAREALETGVDEVRGKAGDAWERLERGFDERMQRTLARLGVPSREDLRALERQVEALRAELRRERAATAARRTAARPGTSTTETDRPDAAQGGPAPGGAPEGAGE